MLQMFSTKNKTVFASQQKTWGLAPGEYLVAKASLSWGWVRLFTGAAELCSQGKVGGLKTSECFAIGKAKAREQNGYRVKGLSRLKIITRAGSFKELCDFCLFLKDKRRLLLLMVINTSFTKLRVLRK